MPYKTAGQDASRVLAFVFPTLFPRFWASNHTSLNPASNANAAWESTERRAR